MMGGRWLTSWPSVVTARYNERVRDLLTARNANSDNLKIREGTHGGVYIENVTEQYVNSIEQVYQMMEAGQANRAIGQCKQRFFWLSLRPLLPCRVLRLLLPRRVCAALSHSPAARLPSLPSCEEQATDETAARNGASSKERRGRTEDLPFPRVAGLATAIILALISPQDHDNSRLQAGAGCDLRPPPGSSKLTSAVSLLLSLFSLDEHE